MSESDPARLTAIENRLTRIENYFKIVAPKSTVVQESAPVPMQASAAAMAASGQERKRAHANVSPTGNWLGFVAIACFVLAAGFLIKLTIDSGWLTPLRQIGLAALLGFALIGAGFMLLARDRAYASLLPAGGIIVLYLTAFASCRYYVLLPFGGGLAVTGLISALSIWLYTRLQHDIYAITAAVGAYVAPLVLGPALGSSFALYYLLLCSLAFIAVSLWLRARILSIVAAYLALAMTAAFGQQQGDLQQTAMLLSLQFTLFALSTFLYSLKHRQPLIRTEAWAHMPVLLLFYALEYNLIEQLQPQAAPWIALGFAAFLLGLYLTAKSRLTGSLNSQVLILGFTTIVVFHAGYLDLMPGDMKPYLIVPLLLGAAVLPWQGLRASTSTGLHEDNPYWLPCLALLAVTLLSYGQILFSLLDSSSLLLLAIVTLGCLWLLIVQRAQALKADNQLGGALVTGAHLLAVTALYRLAEPVGSLAVSAGWLLYAMAVMGLSFNRRDPLLAKSALLVLALAAGKALLIDAASAPTLVRIACLLLTGAILYGCGLLLRRTSRWDQPR